KIFRNRRCKPSAVQTHERRRIRRYGDHDRASTSFRTQDALYEFFHFATALADQTDDDDVGGGVPRHHAEQHALADAAAREQTDALTATDRQQRIDRTNADIERLTDRLSRKWIDGNAG